MLCWDDGEENGNYYLGCLPQAALTTAVPVGTHHRERGSVRQAKDHLGHPNSSTQPPHLIQNGNWHGKWDSIGSVFIPVFVSFAS